MGVTEIKQEISKLEESIEVESQKLDQLRQRIIEEAKPFIKTQLQKNVEQEVKQNFEHTKALGREKLSAMKQQLIALLDDNDHLVEEAFSDDKLWIHVNYDIGNDLYAFSNQKMAEEKIYKAMKILLGEAGRLLVENGYTKPGSMYQWDSGVPRNFDPLNSNPIKSKLLYRGPMSTPESLRKLVQSYTEEIGSLHDLYAKVLKLKKSLSRQEAADLWDEV